MKELFCERIKTQPDFDNYLDKLFEYFVCDHYIYSYYRNTASSGGSWDFGKPVCWYVLPEIDYLKVIFDHIESQVY